MADFRKMLFVLAGLMILIGTASAQTGVTCTAFVANQPTLRQEGVTEPAGDIQISCSGTLVGAQTGSQTLSLYVNGAAITSRQLYTGSSAPSSNPTEAALLVNDCVTTSGTSSSGATCTGSSAPAQGFLQNGALVFFGLFASDYRNSLSASRYQRSRAGELSSRRYLYYGYHSGDFPGSEPVRLGSGRGRVQLERFGRHDHHQFFPVPIDCD